MEVTVNIIDTLFTTIPKDTVVANYTIDELNVDLKMLNSLYYFDEDNKTILTAKDVNSNNLEAINFTVRNWVTAEQIEINDKYPKVVAKVLNKFNKPNVIYKITKDYDLNHCVLTIPEGCILDMRGGSISNGTVTFNNTKVIQQDIENYITATIEGNYKEGQIIYDNTLKKMKLWNGSTWVNLDGTALS